MSTQRRSTFVTSMQQCCADIILLELRWMEKQYGHHVAASQPSDSDTGMSAKKIMEEGNLKTFTLQEVCAAHTHAAFVPPPVRPILCCPTVRSRSI